MIHPWQRDWENIQFYSRQIAAKKEEKTMSTKKTIRIQLVQKEKFEVVDGESKRVREEEVLHDYEVFTEYKAPDEDIKEEFREKWSEKGLKPSEVEVRSVTPFHG